MPLFEPRVHSFFVTYLTLVHGYKELYEVNSIPAINAIAPKFVASMVTSGGPHDASHVVNGFSLGPGTIPASSSFVNSAIYPRCFRFSYTLYVLRIFSSH